MCKHALVNAEGLEGQYVATPSFSDNTVIAHGPDPAGVIAQSHKQGVDDPVVVYVPEKDSIHIY